MVRPLLTELSFDLLVQICEFLQPPKILALRQTSKAFHQVTSQRIVWIHALNRICHDNFLFLPTFSIRDMSDAELERAATTPFRWIALSSSTARNELLQLRITRTIKNPVASVTVKVQREDLTRVYLVPGGRYLVISGWRFLGVWDLGNVSDSEGGRSIGMWEAEDRSVAYINFVVHPTPDGLGILILARSSLAFYVFEIYPQQETPKLAKLAEFTINLRRLPSLTYSLKGTRVVIYERMKGIFIVWDFIANTVASWSITLQIRRILHQIIQITETVIVIHDTRSSLFIYEIPPLEAKKNTLFDIDKENPPILTPVLSYVNENAWFQRPDSWYSGDLGFLPLCIDTSHENQTTRFKLDVSCDFSTTRLVPITEASQTRNRPASGVKKLREYDYRICDGRFVNAFTQSRIHNEAVIEVDVCGGFRSLSSTGQAHSLSQVRDVYFAFPLTHLYSSFCPASARVVFIVENNIAIADFL